MSVQANRDDYWQKTGKGTVRERCQAIFNQELLSDVKFAVCNFQAGSESKTIPAHKFVLAISSPVFYAMFYGELAETKDVVEITDCDYEGLLECLRFIYSDEAKLTPDNVMQLMYLAKKYMLPSLADKCSVYLKGNLDSSNVFNVLPEAQKYEEVDLLHHCWKVIEKETEGAVKSDGFVAIQRSVLEELVANELLNIKEIELFKAVDRWAVRECEKQGLVAEGSVKRRILGELIIQKIHFPAMEQKEFADVVLDSDLLTLKEVKDMVKYFNSVLNTTVEFLESKRGSLLKRQVSRFKSVVFNNGWKHSSKCYDWIYLAVDTSIKLHAVRFFGSYNTEYLASLTITTMEEVIFDGNLTSYSSNVKQSELGEYHGFEIAFKPPIALKASMNYLFKADIRGPSSWYGQGGQSIVNNSKVKFHFSSYKNATCVEEGQFAEFLFSLH